MSEVEAVAKAAEESARTAGKAIDASSGLGSWLDEIFGPSLREMGGILHDRMKLLRAENLVKLRNRWQQLRVERGGIEYIRPLDVKIGCPLLEAASLESNEYIQELFARLLLNASDPSSDVQLRRTFVKILEELQPLDAKLLLAVYKAPHHEEEEGSIKSVYTLRLPDEYLSPEEVKAEGGREPPKEVAIALWNLAQLGCISAMGTWGGGSTIRSVVLTPLGLAFVEACYTTAEPSA